MSVGLTASSSSRSTRMRRSGGRGPAQRGFAAAADDRVQVNPIVVNEAEPCEALRKRGPATAMAPVGPALLRRTAPSRPPLRSRAPGPTVLQGTRDDPFRLAPPRGRESECVGIPLGMILL